MAVKKVTNVTKKVKRGNKTVNKVKDTSKMNAKQKYKIATQNLAIQKSKNLGKTTRFVAGADAVSSIGREAFDDDRYSPNDAYAEAMKNLNAIVDPAQADGAETGATGGGSTGQNSNSALNKIFS